MAVTVWSVVPVAESRVSAPYLDKLGHLCEYLVFAWLLMRALPPRPLARRVAWTTAVSYGLLMELIQWFLPWRSADWTDALSNAVGAWLGVWLSLHKEAEPRNTWRS